MKKILTITILTCLQLSIYAQGNWEFRKWLSPETYWLEQEGYGDLCEKPLWQLFKPDTIWMTDGDIFLEYNQNRQITKLTYDITNTSSEDYTYGKYSFNYSYDHKNRLKNNMFDYWFYSEQDDYSDEEVSNGKRTSIVFYHDEDFTEDNMMLEYIYNENNQLITYRHHDNLSNNVWEIYETTRYTYNDNNEISEIKVFDEYDEMDYHFKGFVWENFAQRKHSYYEESDYVFNDEFKYECAWTADDYINQCYILRNEEWKTWGKDTRTSTDTSYIITHSGSSKIEYFFDKHGNPAGFYNEVFDDNSQKFIYNRAETWETEYDESGIPLVTYYYKLLEDGNKEYIERNSYKFNKTTTSSIMEKKNSFRVFPTLTQGNITISNTASSNINIQVISSNGNIIKNTTSSNTAIELNLTKYKSGLYFVKIITDNSFETHRIIKQ